MAELIKDAVASAGDIDIRECVIISMPSGAEYSLTSGYIGELNIYEDMYRGGLYGNLMVIDANNLSQVIGLTGDEYIRLNVVTPSMDKSAIRKTFKVYSVTDKIMVSDTGKQSYILHFCSPEVFIDSLSPVYRTFKKAKVHKQVQQVFDNFVATSRNGTGEYTPLVIIGETENDIQFTSPGWHPVKILNWLATRAIPAKYKNPNYLFYESNKAFYWANVEAIIDASKATNKVYQKYDYVANNLQATLDQKSGQYVGGYVKDIEKEYQKVEDMRVVTGYNALKNTQTGYLANRLYTFDVITKKRQVFDYNHTGGYAQYTHLEDIGGTSVPPFARGIDATPAGYNQIYMQHDQLYTGVKNNAGDVIDKILPRRTSTSTELTNLKIEITVPGRTDAEVGSIVYFGYPDAAPRDPSDKAITKYDTLYSGYYLITAIRHKINMLKHMMIMELVKDSYQGSTK